MTYLNAISLFPLFQVIQLSVIMTSLATEVVEKICILFHECSSLLRLEVNPLTLLVTYL